MNSLEKFDDALEKGSSKRILTYNVWNVWNAKSSGPENKRYRIEGCAEIILENELDFICLQEYDHCYRYHSDGLHGSLIAEKYEEVVPDGADISYVWNPIFYDRNKYSVIEKGMVDFKEAGAECIEYNYAACADGRSHFRSLTWAVLKDNFDGKIYIVGNLHYSAIGGDNNGIYSHKTEAIIVEKKIRELNSRYDAVSLICGDYNSGVADAKVNCCGGYGIMLRDGFLDTRDLASKKNTIGSCGELDKIIELDYELVGIDHIMTLSNNIKAEGYFVLNTERIRRLSDHNPVILQFNT